VSGGGGVMRAMNHYLQLIESSAESIIHFVALSLIPGAILDLYPTTFNSNETPLRKLVCGKVHGFFALSFCMLGAKREKFV
jgi:hypothetical protein